MKPGVYTVRGTIGPGVSEPVNVRVGLLASDPSLRAHYSGAPNSAMGAWFAFRDHDCVYRPRPMSPFPERIMPAKMPVDLQSTARSIASEAFKAARAAADDDAEQAALREREAAQENLSIDDIALAGISRRSMGVAQ